ncbi:MAG: FKBP-type peptidyl-prolyl cis-trans isomerase [Ilumatobacteraceae bacterium]
MSRPALAPLAGSLALVIALVACGSDDDGSAGSGPTESTVGGTVPELSLVPATTVAVPPVSIPDSIPTELVVTEITPGTGEPAEDGDTVLVNYVGVRSEDGTQFDTNFGGEPIAVTLGAGGVIAGWDQGLVGTTQGQRVQLDIPNDLAYGDTPRGDVIQAGDALSFVVDVLAIVPPITAVEPTAADLPLSSDVTTESEVVDLVEGDGATLEPGQTGVFHFVAARADDGTTLESTWVSDLIPLTMEDGGASAALITGLPGMNVGGRRLVRLPASDADGLEDPATDVFIVADLFAVY